MAYFGNQDLQGELNRLANGGAAYPARYQGPAGAANQWAGTTGWDLLGALNIKAGNTPSNFRSLDGVCNQLSGTSGFDATAALQQKAS